MKKKILVKNTEERKEFLNKLAKVPEGPYCYKIIKRNPDFSLECEYCPFYTTIKAKDKKEPDEIDMEFPDHYVSRCELTGVEDDICCKVCDVNCDYRNGE
jgi:hypothetical protein